MNNTKNTKQHPQEEHGSPVKAAYNKPNLKEFGSVGILTQAGTGTLTELMLNMMSSMDPNRRN